jgi:ABC-2 type transport system ATP-binding protein
MSVIEINNLTKRYGDVIAVNDLSLSVDSGEVFGFLGPNGAGKSTTINAMLDFTTPTTGSVRVFGHDVHEDSVAVRRQSGLLLEGYGAYPRLTGREHVEHAIETKDADDDPDELLARVGLTEASDRRAGGYSKGMRQRMALAVALVGSPELLVFDEPSTGLDPNGARRLRDIVATETERGATVVFSSHILEQVEAVADRIAILLGGTLATVGGVEDLRGDVDRDATIALDVTDVTNGLRDDIHALDGVHDVTAQNSTIEVACDGTGETKLRVLNTAADAGVYRDFTVRETSLDDVFSRYTERRQ